MFNARTAEPYAFAFAFTQAGGFAISLWTGIRIGNLRWDLSTQGWGRMLGYGARTQAASLAAHTNLRLDQTAMSILVAPADLGYYVVAVAMSSVVGPNFSGLNVVLAPAVIGAQNPRSGALRALRTLVLSSVLGGSAALAVWVLTPWLLPAFFGSRFQGATELARVLLVATVFQGANLLLGTALRGLNRPGAPAVAEGLGALVTIGLLLALLPAFGGMGAAVASILCYSIVSVFEVFMIARAESLRFVDFVSDLKGLFLTNLPKRSRTPS